MRASRWAGAVMIVGALAGPAHRAEAAVPERSRDAVKAGCASTSDGAVLAAGNSAGLASSGMHGYRVGSLVWDPLLRQGWALIQSCDHPERPATMVATGLTRPGESSPLTLAAEVARSQAAVPTVRIGDGVRVWRLDRTAHVEMRGTSEENGSLGSRVRVRLAVIHDMDGQAAPTQYLVGVVRGVADVEMEP